MNIFVVLLFAVFSPIRGMVEEEDHVCNTISTYINEKLGEFLSGPDKEYRSQWSNDVAKCGTALKNCFIACDGNLIGYKNDIKKLCDRLKNKIMDSFDVFKEFTREKGGGVKEIHNGELTCF